MFSGKILRSALGAAFGLLLSVSVHATLFERQPANFQAEAVNAGREGKLLALFLTLPDCPGCLEMERSVLNDNAVEKVFGQRYRTARLDLAQTSQITVPAGQQQTPSDFANRLHAYATPSFVFFNERGEVLFRYTGTLDGKGLKRLGDYVSRGEYEKRPFVPPKRVPQGQKLSGEPHAGHSRLALHADAPDVTLPIRPEFKLEATDGSTHQLADFQGVGVALAVGYTQCPDVCPTTLAELKAAVESLPARYRSDIQVLFATLDPERDQIALLREYADAFRPNGGRPILALRGNAVETANLIRQLRLVAEKQPSASMGYTLDHTAGVFLFDASGRLLGLSPYGQPVKKLASDLLNIASAAHLNRPIAKN